MLRHLREATPSDVVVDAGLIQAIYPVHPATLELLEEVRDRFSQARGIVDFTVTRLAGDLTRHAEPLLDRPLGEFLTADAIVDHYQELLQVQPEFLPLAERLFPYYERQLPALFEKPARRRLAERVLKALALVYLSRSRHDVSSAELVCWLGLTAARVAPERNVAIVDKLLDELARRGRYVARHQGRYRLDLEDRSADELARLMQRELADLQDQGEGLFPQLLPLLRGERFGLLRQPTDRWLPRHVVWHHHRRAYHVCLTNDDPPPHPEGALLCVRLPWGRAEPARCPTLIPSRLEPSAALREAVALARILERPLEDAMTAHARRELSQRLDSLEEQLLAAFHAPRRFGPDGAPAMDGPAHRPARSLETWLTEEARWLMRATYPAFERFAPTDGPLPEEALRAFVRFVEEADVEAPAEDELVSRVRDGYLVPMQLLKPHGLGYRLPAALERHDRYWKEVGEHPVWRWTARPGSRASTRWPSSPPTPTPKPVGSLRPRP